MHVGIAGPVTFRQLSPHLNDGDSLPEGMGGTAVTALVVGLLNNGHTVSVYTLDPRVDGAVHAHGERLSVHVGAYRPRPRTRAADFFRAERQAIAEFIRSDDAEVINAHWTYEFALGSLAARSDAIVTVRDWAPRVLASSRDVYRAVRFMMDRRCLNRAAHLTCTSPYIQGLLRAKGLDARLTPNMLSHDLAGFEPRVWSGGRRIVSVANGFSGWKNVRVLLEALPYMRDAQLVLVGLGTEPGGEADLAARELGVQDRVTFAGPLEHRETLMTIASADVLVHPSLEESFGNVLIEAMALGVPVVGGESSGAVPWVLDGGDAGVLTDVRAPEAIAAAVEHLLSSREVWDRYSAAASGRVQREFGEQAVVAEYVDAYRQVMAE